MKREVSISIFAVLILAAAILTVYYLNVGLTGFAVFEQNTNATFNEGTYSNVLHNGNTVVLAANQTNGTYTSKVFDANGSTTWNNLTWQGSSVTFEVRSCSSACSNESFSSANLSNLNLSGRYFQYRASFNSANDFLTNVSVDYAAVAQQAATPLSVSISEPSGKKSSSINLPLNISYTGQSLTCIYRIEDASDNAETKGNTTLEGCSNTTFNLGAGDGSYIIRVYVANSNWSASASSSFSVEVASNSPSPEQPVEVPVPPPVVPQPVTSLSLGEISGQNIIQGDSKQLTISAQNTGTVPLTSCTLKGDDSGLATVNDSAKNIGPGGSATFSFSVSVPEETAPGAYTLGLSLNCAQTSASKTLSLNVLQKKLDFNITNVQRTRQNRVSVDYALTELAGENQDVQIYFSIKDSSGVEVANASQNRSVDADATDEFRTNVPINESLNGTMTLSAAFNSQIYSSTVLEPIDLSIVTGSAIFGGVGGAGSIILVVVVIVVLGAIFFVVRKLRKSKSFS